MATPALLGVSYLKTEAPDAWPEDWPVLSKYLGDDPMYWLADLDLTGEDIVERPSGWLPYDIARKDFLAVWCKREETDCRKSVNSEAFGDEWMKRLSAQTIGLKKPRWSGADSIIRDLSFGTPNFKRTGTPFPDLRNSELVEVFLAGAQMHFLDLRQTRFWGSDLRASNFERANLMGAQFNDADLQGANFGGAKLAGSSFRYSRSQNASFNSNELYSVDFSHANLSQAEFFYSSILDSNLIETNLSDATFREAILLGVDLQNAQMPGSHWKSTLLSGHREIPVFFGSADLRSSRGSGGAIRFTDFENAQFDLETDWRNVFFDSSVKIPPMLFIQSFNPCLIDHWLHNTPVLSDEDFFASWRGWLMLSPDWDDQWWEDLSSVPPEYHDVTPTPPPADCKWITDPPPSVASDN